MTAEQYDEFSNLVNAGDRTEVQCTRYLGYAQDLLLPTTAIKSTIHLENYNMYGRSDFYIVARLVNDRKDEENFAYFFEAKAPQLYVMNFDSTLKRCAPSADLMQAENQLMHYVGEASGNSEFLAQHDISDGRNVRLGGIIIGRRSDRYLRGDPAEQSQSRLANRALKLREEYFYRSTGMRVITWDRILDFVKPQPST